MYQTYSTDDANTTMDLNESGSYLLIPKADAEWATFVVARDSQGQTFGSASVGLQGSGDPEGLGGFVTINPSTNLSDFGSSRPIRVLGYRSLRLVVLGAHGSASTPVIGKVTTYASTRR